MIVDFTVKNFRSIKTEQLLSLYADKKPKHHAGNIAYIEDDLGVLKTCGIYGPNAAGKTNILLAFDTFRKLITDSGDLKDGDQLPWYEPYLLSESTRNAPTRFEIEFYVAQVRYAYQVEYNNTEILFEKLDYYPASRAANLFTRTSPTDIKKVKFGEHYKGGKKQIAFFSNNSYLSKAGNTPDSPPIIREVYNYFRKNTVAVYTGDKFSIFEWYENSSNVSAINTFLKKIDLGIDRFDMEQRLDSRKFNFPKEMPKDVKQQLITELSRESVFYHRTDNGEVMRFEKNKESQGTIKIFEQLPLYIEVLRDGNVLFLDEIESSLHPHIAELIIKLFNDPLVNKNNAQLIFTTHDLSLMSPQTMRKDQIYLTEKSVENGTEIDCLENYESALKDSSPFAKWYDEGRLGAIPTINYRDISDAIKEAF